MKDEFLLILLRGNFFRIFYLIVSKFFFCLIYLIQGRVGDPNPFFSEITAVYFFFGAYNNIIFDFISITFANFQPEAQY